MLETLLEILELAAGAITLFAVVVIVVGFALASGRYALRWRERKLEQNFKNFKIDLGRTLTLGLEILVLADVIESIVIKPTFLSLAILASIVVIRTILSWTLTLEIEGHWPWQASAEDQAHV